MVDYYKHKREAEQKITEILQELSRQGKSANQEQLIAQICIAYNIGKLTITRYLEDLQKLGKITKNEIQQEILITWNPETEDGIDIESLKWIHKTEEPKKQNEEIQNEIENNQHQ